MSLFRFLGFIQIGFVLLSLSQSSYATYKLQNFPDFRQCPFLHEDEYAQDISRLHDIIQGYLSTKIEYNDRCRGEFQSIAGNLSTIDQLFADNRNPSLYEEISNEVLSSYLMELETEALIMESNGESTDFIDAQILDLRDRIANNTINLRYNLRIFNETRKNNALATTFNNLNEAITTMARMNPDCTGYLGGWNAILPTILNSISSLSGLAGSSYSAVIGASTQIILSLIYLLQDTAARTALRDVIQHKNNKLLACTYFSIKATACRYRKALRFSKEEKKITELIYHRYKDKNTAIYERFLDLQDKKSDFENIFINIGAMGSAVTMDVELIRKYFDARMLSPDTLLLQDEVGLPPDESDESIQAERIRREWLIKIKERGIEFEGASFLGPKPLKQQVQDALEYINQKVADIKAVEFVLSRRRSFIDLKHELDTNPLLIKEVRSFIEFFQDAMDQKIISTTKIGIIRAALRILVDLEAFLNIKYDNSVGDFENLESATRATDPDSLDHIDLPEPMPLDPFVVYTNRVNKSGQKLFATMAEGAIAQISRQTVLLVGSTVQQRINRVFSLLEDEFFVDEIRRRESGEPMPEGYVAYSSYKKSRRLIFEVTNSYHNFVGTSKTFRLEDVEVALKSLEKGFKNEIRQLVNDSLHMRSQFYPDLEGTTAAHMCALFSNALGTSGVFGLRSKRLLKTCQRRFKTLELLKLIDPPEIEIDWENPCFYTSYRSLFNTQKALYDRMLKLGFENPFAVKNRS